VRALTVHGTRHIAVVARHGQILVSVARFAEPTIDRASGFPDLTPVRCTIVFDVVQCEKLEVPLTAADAPDVAAAVMCECRESVVAIASLSVLGVADLAPGVDTLGAL
jgi:hypothetical protein